MPRDKRWRESRRLGRSGPTRDPIPYILVVCEGKYTEREYIQGFRDANCSRTVRLECVPVGGGDPKIAVEHAIRLQAGAERDARRMRDDNRRFDEVWCLCDVDGHARLPDAVQQARDNGIELLVSNPCIEFWLLLHFVDHRAALSGKQAEALLRKHVPDYDKHIRIDAFLPAYSEAAERAARLEAWHTSNGSDGNPSTGLFRLTEKIQSLGKR